MLIYNEQGMENQIQKKIDNTQEEKPILKSQDTKTLEKEKPILKSQDTKTLEKEKPFIDNDFQNLEFMSFNTYGYDDKGYRLRLAFFDDSSNQVTVNGQVTIQLINSSNTVVYEEIIRVHKDDFKHTLNKFTGSIESFVYIYIPHTLIEKSQYSSGMARIVFEGNLFGFDFEIYVDDLPTYTQKKNTFMPNEEQYQTNSVLIYQQDRTNTKEVTIERAGYYMYEPYAWSDPKEVFRIDLSIKNLHLKAQELRLYNTVLVDNNKQYNMMSYDSTYDEYSKIHHNVINSGSIFFEDIPKDTQYILLIFETKDTKPGRDWDRDYYYYEHRFNIPIKNILQTSE